MSVGRDHHLEVGFSEHMWMRQGRGCRCQEHGTGGRYQRPFRHQTVHAPYESLTSIPIKQAEMGLPRESAHVLLKPLGQVVDKDPYLCWQVSPVRVDGEDATAARCPVVEQGFKLPARERGSCDEIGKWREAEA